MANAPVEPILDVHCLRKTFPVNKGLLPWDTKELKAVDDVSFTIGRGETLSVVGESGCGKSTLGRAILNFVKPTSGEIWLDGYPLTNISSRSLRKLRRKMQVVFQDPAASLSPRMRVRDIIAEPMINFGIITGRRAIDARVADLLEQVRLPKDAANRYPREFSGGQRQRIAIARALAQEPALIVCDEAVSALDVSSKAQIVNLLSDVQQRLGLSLMFISHDLAVVEHISHRVAVMYLGKIVELADRDKLFANPSHPYTRALLSAVLDPSPLRRRKRVVLQGEVPSPIDPPSGCRFRTRCPYAFDRCASEEPQMRVRGDGQESACHLESLPPLD